MSAEKKNSSKDDFNFEIPEDKIPGKDSKESKSKAQRFAEAQARDKVTPLRIEKTTRKQKKERFYEEVEKPSIFSLFPFKKIVKFFVLSAIAYGAYILYINKDPIIDEVLERRATVTGDAQEP